MFNKLSLRSKLILILLGVSLLASTIVIVLGYFVGVESISREVYDRLTAARNAKAFEIEEYFQTEAKVTQTIAANELTAEAVIGFTQAFRRITRSDTIDCSRDLEAYYTRYLDSLGQNLPVRKSTDAYYPNSAAACYLQYHYISQNPDATARQSLLTAGDGSEYSATHARYHPFFVKLTEDFGFYDAFLVDAQTKQIVYSTMKEADFATNLVDGPYRNSNLARLVESVERNDDLREAQIVDFAYYRPSYGSPAAFIGSPIFYRDELVGIFVLQLSIDRINRLTNYGREWAQNGLGETGEVLLVGEDYLLRSDPRSYLTDPQKFTASMEAQNISHDRMGLLESVGPILVTELRSSHITRALRGERSSDKVVGYDGTARVSAFTPVDLPGGIRWALVVEMDESEAMAPVDRFRNFNIAGMAFIIGLVTILAMLITRRLIAPIDRLTAGAMAVRAGDTDVRVRKSTDDELGRLTEVFNDMVASIDEQKQEITKQAQENNDLLYSRFPDSIAERYRNGETNIVDRFEGVTVLSVDLRGTTDFMERALVEAWPIVQEISTRFTEISDEMGMEVIHAVPDGYLCVCGMNIPRLDNVRRIVILAMRFREVIEVINQKHQLDIQFNAGLAQGPTLAGILEDESKNYVVWGPTIDQAQRLSNQPEENVVYGTESLIETLEGNFHFDKLKRIKLNKSESIRIGRLVGRVSDLKEAGVDISTDGLVGQSK